MKLVEIFFYFLPRLLKVDVSQSFTLIQILDDFWFSCATVLNILSKRIGVHLVQEVSHLVLSLNIIDT